MTSGPHTTPPPPPIDVALTDTLQAPDASTSASSSMATSTSTTQASSSSSTSTTSTTTTTSSSSFGTATEAQGDDIAPPHDRGCGWPQGPGHGRGWAAGPGGDGDGDGDDGGTGTGGGAGVRQVAEIVQSVRVLCAGMTQMEKEKLDQCTGTITRNMALLRVVVRDLETGPTMIDPAERDAVLAKRNGLRQELEETKKTMKGLIDRLREMDIDLATILALEAHKQPTSTKPLEKTHKP
ncbi:hypothetical protein Pelo_8911 [Pelomyxa schiedti]|nr:hypothetical protein Pelo_8911 [Pelomyxa schiedti]